MKKISEEPKEAVLAKLSSPDRKSVAVVAAEKVVSTATLYNWRKQPCVTAPQDLFTS